MSKPRTPDWPELRWQMVEQQLRARGIVSERVLSVMNEVPRHLFIDEKYLSQAYDDHPLPIGEGQTISQPYMVARMTELCDLQPTDIVLEVGAGSGYQTAVLARLAAKVYATEINAHLANRLKTKLLDELALPNVEVEARDGSGGWPEHAPFNAILVAAGAPRVPLPMLEQLADGGRLVIPTGDMRGLQILQCFVRHKDTFKVVDDTPCRFVDLLGRYGWSD